MQGRHMTQTSDERIWPPPVTDESLAEVTRRICSAGSPLKIVLFGSRALGTANENSDTDLLIVEDTGVNCREQRGLYWDAIGDTLEDKDLIVVTIDEVLTWRNVPNHVISVALREGRVLYENARRFARYQLSSECSSQDSTTQLVLEGLEPKTTLDLAREWFRRAGSDLDNGTILSEEGKTFDGACFFAQQAIEKYLKGFLILHSKSWPKTHSLDELRWDCLQTAELPGMTEESLKTITEYVNGRYKPDFWPAREEARYALDVAAGVREVILKVVPEKARP